MPQLPNLLLLLLLGCLAQPHCRRLSSGASAATALTKATHRDAEAVSHVSRWVPGSGIACWTWSARSGASAWRYDFYSSIAPHVRLMSAQPCRAVLCSWGILLAPGWSSRAALIS